MSELHALPRHSGLRVGELPGRGRALIAGEPLAAGELLEAAPVIPLLPADEPERQSILYDYPFAWETPPFTEAIALGVVSMANHSTTPNARFETDIPAKVVRLYALRDIEAGEEITIDYAIPLWFEVAQ